MAGMTKRGLSRLMMKIPCRAMGVTVPTTAMVRIRSSLLPEERRVSTTVIPGPRCSELNSDLYEAGRRAPNNRSSKSRQAPKEGVSNGERRSAGEGHGGSKTKGKSHSSSRLQAQKGYRSQDTSRSRGREKSGPGDSGSSGSSSEGSDSPRFQARASGRKKALVPATARKGVDARTKQALDEELERVPINEQRRHKVGRY